MLRQPSTNPVLPLLTNRAAGCARQKSQPARSRAALSVATLAVALLLPGAALAQEDLPGDEAPHDDTEALEKEGAGVDLDEEDEALEDESVSVEDSAAAQEESEKTADPEEKKSGKQLLIGLRHRMIIVPKFLINSFGLDGGRTFVTQGFGGEVGAYLGERDNGVMVLGSIWYAPYHLKPTVWKQKNKDDNNWETIESDLGAIYLTFDAAWDFRLINRLSLNVGMGVGIGIVEGKLYRNETYIDTTDPDFPAKEGQPPLSTCSGPFDPEGGAACPVDGDYGESTYWPVYPWLNFQMGLRYQPVDSFVGRLDIGVGTSGFWLGIGGDYSLWL